MTAMKSHQYCDTVEIVGGLLCGSGIVLHTVLELQLGQVVKYEGRSYRVVEIRDNTAFIQPCR